MNTRFFALTILFAFLTLRPVAVTAHYSTRSGRPHQHLSRAFNFPKCMYSPFHNTFDLFAVRNQKREGKVTVNLSRSKLRITYSLKRCKIKATHVTLVDKAVRKLFPHRFACTKKVSWPKKKITLVCPLTLFSRVPCCQKFLIYAHASLKCGRKLVQAYAGVPSCRSHVHTHWGRNSNRRVKKFMCNVIAVHPPCPRHCRCNRKCICPRPTPSMLSSPIPSISNSPIASMSTSPMPSASNSARPSRSSSPIPSVLSSPIPSMSNTPTLSPSSSLMPLISSSPMPSMSASSVPAMSSSSIPSMSNSATPSPSSSPIPSMSSSPIPSMSSSPIPSMSSSPMPSMSSSPIPSMSNSPIPSASSSPAPSISNSPSPSASSSPVPSMSNSPIPSMSNSPSPSVSPSPCVCPNCFICTGIDGNGKSICMADPNTNDAECNPCEEGGDQFCEATGLPNSFKCCPPSSLCKSSTIPNRLGVPQNSLEVTFVCSRNCGGVCADIRNNDGTSNACTLFSPLPLNDDMDSDTDDLLNLCPDVSAQ